MTQILRNFIRYLAYETGLCKTVVHDILTKDLGYTKKCARWVPRLLTDDHKAKHLEMARDFIRRCEADPDFKKKIVTMDEVVIYFKLSYLF